MSISLSTLLSSGFTGSQGPQGTQGLQGVIGSQGTQGVQGLQGQANSFQGLQGTQGVQGSVGLTGSSTSLTAISPSTSYTLTANDSGKHINTTSDVVVPQNVLSAGDIVAVFNNSSGTITIIEGSGVNLYKSGTTNTGNRSLSQRGLCTILCVASNTFVISGSILI